MASPHRNLLIVMCHGLRSDTLGNTGAWPNVTPHLSQLLQRSARMTAVSACPADPGGAISLLTALHVRQHGNVLPLNGDCWPALLAQAGAHVAGVGCVQSVAAHLAQAVTVAPPDMGDEGGCAYLRFMRDSEYLGDLLEQRRQRQRGGLIEPLSLAIDPAHDIDGFIAERAAAMIEQMPNDRQWALIVMFSGPGNDLPPPAMYDQVVEPQFLESGFVPVDFTSVDALAEFDYPRVMLQRLTPQKIGRIRADYLGRVSLIDYCVGQLMQKLAERTDAERTWSVLAADRGMLLGEHGLVGHRSFLDGAVQAPVIVTPPTPARAAQPDDPISTVDVAATIALLGGCDLSASVPGRSLLPLLQDEPVFPAPPGGAAISEFGRRLMLQTDSYKVVFDNETRSAVGLFDRVADPDEKHNLIGTKQGSNLLDSMRWRLGDALLPLGTN